MSKIKADVVVIGKGLVGSMVARYLTDKGMEVVVIDSNEPMAASKCCFGLWKDGWVNQAIRKEYEDGMKLLSKYVGEPEEIKLFNMDKDEEQVFLKVNPFKLLDSIEPVFAKVTSVKNNEVVAENVGIEMVFKAKKAVVICAGAYTTELLESSGYNNAPQIDLCYGATIHANVKIEENRILQWAPYRQSILLKDGKKSVMYGDGFVVKNPKANDPRVEEGSKRLQQHFNEIVGANVSNDKIAEVREGYRPYMKKGTPHFVNVHDKNLISATGGAKNTLILAGHMTKEVWKKVKEI